jgi:hypothetical protein
MRVLLQWLSEKASLVTNDGVVSSYETLTWNINSQTSEGKEYRNTSSLVSCNLVNYEAINHTPNNNEVNKEFIVDLHDTTN